jgi:hypothetical protein
MYKSILLLLYKWLEKINKNSDVALDKIRQHLYFMDYEDRDSDIYIVTYLKSGTTWMQVILYNLLTDGNMDFNHIYDVSPWPSNEAFNNVSPEKVNSLPSPRILKSHDKYDYFNEGIKAKFIYIYRDGKDVSLSLYHHNKNYRDPDVTFGQNFETYFIDEAFQMNCFKYNSEWLQNKSNHQILYVSYEELKNQFDKTVKKIADYLDVELSDEMLERTRKHASFEYMKEHETKFGETPPVTSKLVFNQFIRKGVSGEGANYLTPEQNEAYELNFKKYIEPYLSKFPSDNLTKAIES